MASALPVQSTPTTPHPAAEPAVRLELHRPARPSAGQARLLIPALPRSRLCQEKQFTTSSEVARSREGPGRLPALLRRYKNHLKGHFVSRRAAFTRGGEQRKPRARKPPFQPQVGLDTPEPLLPLPAFRRGCRSLEPVCGAGGVRWRGARCPQNHLTPTSQTEHP